MAGFPVNCGRTVTGLSITTWQIFCRRPWWSARGHGQWARSQERGDRWEAMGHILLVRGNCSSSSSGRGGSVKRYRRKWRLWRRSRCEAGAGARSCSHARTRIHGERMCAHTHSRPLPFPGFPPVALPSHSLGLTLARSLARSPSQSLSRSISQASMQTSVFADDRGSSGLRSIPSIVEFTHLGADRVSLGEGAVDIAHRNRGRLGWPDRSPACESPHRP